MKLTCFRISNQALGGERLPERIKILNWGENPSVKGINPKVTALTASRLPIRQKKAGYDRVALDYEHNTVPESPEFRRTQEPRKVAGYGVPEVVEGEGLFLANMTYTPSGVENAREYIDLSPAVELDPDTGEVLFMHSSALCRQGAVEDLHFFNVELNEERKGPGIMEEMKSQLAALTQALADIQTKIAALEKPAALEALSAKTAELEGKIATLSADFASELARRDKEGLVAGAAREGKIVDPAVVTALSVADLKEHIAKLPKVVPTDRRTPREVRESPERASLIEQFNAIKDAAKRAEFYAANKTRIFSAS